MLCDRSPFIGENRGNHHELKEDHTIVIVTHNLQQAARVSDFAGFMYLGQLVEFDTAQHMFLTPKDPRTQQFITGRFG